MNIKNVTRTLTTFETKIKLLKYSGHVLRSRMQYLVYNNYSKSTSKELIIRRSAFDESGGLQSDRGIYFKAMVIQIWAEIISGRSNMYPLTTKKKIENRDRLLKTDIKKK